MDYLKKKKIKTIPSTLKSYKLKYSTFNKKSLIT